MVRKKLSRKAREWVLRYLPAEVLGTMTAFMGAVFVHDASGSLAASAFAAAVTEGLGFYGYILVRDTRQYYLRHRRHPRLRRIGVAVTKTARGIVLEFGPAELLDSFLVRPFCMYIGPAVTGHFAFGILAGKLSADVFFYACAICCYEIHRRWVDTPASAAVGD